MPRKNEATAVQEASNVSNIIDTPLGAMDASTGEIIQESNSFINLPTENSTNDLIPDFVISLDESARRTNILKQYVREQMTENEDYGIIPGTSGKPTLFKPGAEKLNSVFGLAPIVEVTNRVENWEEGFVSYEVKVTLKNKRNDKIEAEGIGSCNSRERRYKNQEAANVANTILKMAKKRALIDATLSAVSASGIFTQDVEDLAANGALNNSNYTYPAKAKTGNYSSNGKSNYSASPNGNNQGIKPWNPAFTAKIGPCAEVKDDKGKVVTPGKTLDEMTNEELKWYYDQAVVSAEKGGEYAPQDRGKIEYIKSIAPDIESYTAVDYKRNTFKKSY